MKQELQSEKKLHFELQQLHKICGKKFEMLQTRYQNCIEQLDYYQSENENIMKSKQKIEEELYQLKATINSQAEQMMSEEGKIVPIEEGNKAALNKAAESLATLNLMFNPPKAESQPIDQANVLLQA